MTFIKVKSLRPKRSEAEKSQRVEKNKRMRFLHVGRNDITYVMLKIIEDMKLWYFANATYPR